MARDVLIDTGRIETLIVELRGFEREVGEATYHALNRTMDQVITQIGRIVPKDYAIKAKEVKDSFRGGIKRPTRSNLEASLTSKGNALSLAHFPHSPSTPSSRKYKVKATIKKNGGRKIIQSTPKPFVMTTGARSAEGMQYNIFKREGAERLPVKVLRTLSIPQMITNENLTEEIQNFATDKFNERLQHEIERSMLSIGGRLR
jgi:hypothetical protein